MQLKTNFFKAEESKKEQYSEKQKIRWMDGMNVLALQNHPKAP